MNIFEQASRLKLRFSTTRGFLTTEQLWELSLTDLNKLYINVNEEVSVTSTKGLIKDSETKTDKENNLRLELIEHIYTVIKEEKEAKEQRLALQSQKARLQQLIQTKKDEALTNLPVEELEKQLKELG